MECEHNECHKNRQYLREVRRVACASSEPGEGWGGIITRCPAVVHEETYYLDIYKVASLDYKGEKINLNDLGGK